MSDGWGCLLAPLGLIYVLGSAVLAIWLFDGVLKMGELGVAGGVLIFVVGGWRLMESIGDIPHRWRLRKLRKARFPSPQ